MSYWNCFGFDRSATAFYFAAPVAMSKVLMGKNLASLLFIYLEVLILTGVTLALRLSAGWQSAVEALIVMGICSLYTLALGNISSVRYPRSLNPERVSQGGGAGKQGLILFFYPVTLLPVGLAYLARYAFNSELIFSIGLAIAAVIGGVLYAMSMESAAYRALEQRESSLRTYPKAMVLSQASSGVDRPAGTSSSSRTCPGLLHLPLGHDGISAFGAIRWHGRQRCESSCCRCFSPHEGHSISGTSELRRTSFSNLVPQSWQLYS